MERFERLPCINCIVYSMCKNRYFNDGENSTNIATALAIMLVEDECKLLKHYLELYDYEVTDEMLKVERINQELKKIRKDRYNNFMDHMGVEYGANKS